MALEKFKKSKFRKSTADVITKANSIIAAYQAMGFSLTLRQLYYQFVARGLLPNKQQNYKRLGEIVNNARLAGLIDWNAIEDRTRNVRQIAMWSSPQSILDAVAEQYAENPWDTQEYQPEVWIEKDALVGVIEPICSRMRVPYFACRGYTSQSEQYRAGKRFAATLRAKKRPLVLHLGDHDPSGLDMTRDNGDRLRMFARKGVVVKRLALNMDQVEQYNPPPNPAKESDSRFEGYRASYGDESWELDALDPPVIEKLIQDALDEIIDTSAWDSVMSREEANKADLEAVAQRWADVSEYLRDQ